MSLAMAEWAAEQTPAPTRTASTKAQKSVLNALAHHHNDVKGCFPGQKRIVRRTGLSERAVGYAVKALEEQGYIKVERRRQPNTGRPTSNRYTLITDSTARSQHGHDSLATRMRARDRRKPTRPGFERALREAMYSEFCKYNGFTYTPQPGAFLPPYGSLNPDGGGLSLVRGLYEKASNLALFEEDEDEDDGESLFESSTDSATVGSDARLRTRSIGRRIATRPA